MLLFLYQRYKLFKTTTNNKLKQRNYKQTKMTSMTTFEKNSSNEHGISLCIPFVFKHITKEKIFAVIRSQRVGHIERIDIVQKDEKHNKVYVHFARSRWGNPSNIQYSKDVLLNLQAGIPWIVPYSRYGYWKLWISESEKPEKMDVALTAPRVKRRECIDLTETNPVPSSIVLDLNDPIQARIASTSPSNNSYYQVVA